MGAACKLAVCSLAFGGPGFNHATSTLSARPTPYTMPRAIQPPMTTRRPPRTTFAPPRNAPRKPNRQRPTAGGEYKPQIEQCGVGRRSHDQRTCEPAGGWLNADHCTMGRPGGCPPQWHPSPVVAPARMPSRRVGSWMKAALSSGSAAPTVKQMADTTAACSGLASSSMSAAGRGAGVAQQRLVRGYGWVLHRPG